MLCQTGKIAEISAKYAYKTIGSTLRIRVIRNATMSSHCRCLRTANSGGDAKLLIREGGATVAEGRQDGTKATQRNNNNKQRSSHVACHCCDKNTKKIWAEKSVGTKKSPFTCENSDGEEIGATRDDEKVCKSNILQCALSLIFDITSALVPLLYFDEIWPADRREWTNSDRGRRRQTTWLGLPVTHCFTRTVIVLTVSSPIRGQHNPLIEWWVNAHIRGRTL